MPRYSTSGTARSLSGAGAAALACLLFAVPALAGSGATADPDPAMARFPVCFDYGCATRQQVSILRSEFEPVRALLRASEDAADERHRIAQAVGMMERVVGTYTPTRFDQPENGHDSLGRGGQMDCVDEATNASIYLRVFDYQGLVRWHRVLGRIHRAPLILNTHYAAQIQDKATAQRYAVDSWFRANGEPAVVQPIEDWLRGAPIPVAGQAAPLHAALRR